MTTAVASFDRREWQRALRIRLARPETASLLAERGLSQDTVMQVAATVAHSSDAAGVTPSGHATAARRCGRSTRTVQRARAFLSELGFELLTSACRFTGKLTRSLSLPAPH